CLVAMEIVDGLEVVQVDHEQSRCARRRIGLRRGRDQRGNGFVQVAPVTKTRERVGHGCLAQTLIRTLEIVVTTTQLSGALFHFALQSVRIESLAAELFLLALPDRENQQTEREHIRRSGPGCRPEWRLDAHRYRKTGVVPDSIAVGRAHPEGVLATPEICVRDT